MKKGSRDDNWTRLKKRLLIEFRMLRIDGCKHLLKKDQIWVTILEDINPTRKCNLSHIKKKWQLLKRNWNAVTQMIVAGVEKISKIADSFDVVEAVVFKLLIHYYNSLFLIL